ncbi:hypothetical protein [Spiroplasma floricola]|uniref:Uncharacterized protein n=1 Tax=Spiroplasma floricola 23-6 TaxID=1336749 RepID=A0A2K8SFJ3_9MOLU|nr:hypothetical protein [Spiroplasma floricola]AUB32125.1 hypothetical protein SFLOR_v1c10790 [Spiroplasma floricola 23-6]
MTKEELKDKLADFKVKKNAKETEIEKCKEAIKQAKLEIKIKKNELKNIISEAKILKSSFKRQEM